MSSTCTYTHPLKNTESQIGESEWECPRTPSQDTDRCQFHYRIERWKEGEVRPEQVQEAFKDSIVAGSREDLKFIGGRFGPLDLRFDLLDAPTSYPIDLSAATFFGPVNLRQARVRQPMILDRCQFTGGLDATGAIFERDLSVHGARSDNDIEFDEAKLNGAGRFDGVEVTGRLGFQNAEVRDTLALGNPNENDEKNHATNETIVTETVDLTNAKIDGFNGWNLKADILNLSLANAGSVIIRGASFDSFLARAMTVDHLSIDKSVVDNKTNLSHSMVTGRTIINGRFGGSFTTFGARFRELTAITNCVFSDKAAFDSTTFEGRTVVHTQVRGGLSFEGATFDDTLMLFVSNPVGPMVVHMDRASISDGALSAVLKPEDSRFSWKSLRETLVDEEDQTAESNRELGTPFGEWPDERFDNDQPVYFDLSHATLGDVKFVGCGDENTLDHFRLLDTDFEQFDFTDYREEFRTANWRFHRFKYHSVDSNEDQSSDDGSSPEVGDDGPFKELASGDGGTEPQRSEDEVANEQEVEDRGQINVSSDRDAKETNMELRNCASRTTDEIGIIDEQFRTALRRVMQYNLDRYNTEFDAATNESTYQRAKLGAKRTGDEIVASELFRQEMTYRRWAHWDRLRSKESVAGRLRALWAFVANSLLALSCGYGERPSRVIITALATIAVYGWVVFPTLGSNEMAANKIAGIVFSMEAFVSLILGDPTPAAGSALFTLAAVTEAFAGAFLIALFVVTLTRSIHR